ncbi:MAG: DUF177 domain-containing protein [Nitrospirales bacterium]|nr:DUF177 domain-containing protein [Nitrospirales bacterium]
MAWTFKLSDISASGLAVDQGVGAVELELSPEDGMIVGEVRSGGSLIKPDDATVYFEGRITGAIVRECVRCLDNFTERLNLSCTALFKKSAVVRAPEAGGRNQKHRDDDSDEGDEVYPLINNQIDLLPVIREHIILSTPLRALCADECQGLCQRCGANLNTGKCSCPVPMPVLASEGVFHPDLSMANRPSSVRSPGHRRRGSTKQSNH